MAAGAEVAMAGHAETASGDISAHIAVAPVMNIPDLPGYELSM
jgi:hypothetical protein